MKKNFLIFSIILFISIIYLKSHTLTPYKGKYIYEKNNLITLELINNEKFLIINTRNRSTDYISGQYSITNNKIILNSTRNKSCFFKEDTLEGTIDGSRINFYSSKENKTYIFIKP